MLRTLTGVALSEEANRLIPYRGYKAFNCFSCHCCCFSWDAQRCLENVKDGKSVAPSLRLMQRIIDAQPESSSNSNASHTWSSRRVAGSSAGVAGAGDVRCKDEILETLDRDCHLLELLVDVSGLLPVYGVGQIIRLLLYFKA